MPVTYGTLHPMTFKALMEKIGLSDAELAKRLFVGRMTAYRWNRALKVPTPHMRRALCGLAGVKVDAVHWDARNGKT